MMRPSNEEWKKDARVPPARGPRVILADDDEDLRSLLASTLRRDGCEVIEASTGFELLELLADQVLQPCQAPPCELVITDIRLPGASGLQALERLRGRDWSIPLMVITGFGDDEIHEEARRLGVAAMFDKPFDLDDFRTAVLNLVGSGR